MRVIQATAADKMLPLIGDSLELRTIVLGAPKLQGSGQVAKHTFHLSRQSEVTVCVLIDFNYS